MTLKVVPGAELGANTFLPGREPTAAATTRVLGPEDLLIGRKEGEAVDLVT